jgi:hypothetical protein
MTADQQALPAKREINELFLFISFCFLCLALNRDKNDDRKTGFVLHLHAAEWITAREETS